MIRQGRIRILRPNADPNGHHVSGTGEGMIDPNNRLHVSYPSLPSVPVLMYCSPQTLSKQQNIYVLSKEEEAHIRGTNMKIARQQISEKDGRRRSLQRATSMPQLVRRASAPAMKTRDGRGSKAASFSRHLHEAGGLVPITSARNVLAAQKPSDRTKLMEGKHYHQSSKKQQNVTTMERGSRCKTTESTPPSTAPLIKKGLDMRTTKLRKQPSRRSGQPSTTRQSNCDEVMRAHIKKSPIDLKQQGHVQAENSDRHRIKLTKSSFLTQSNQKHPANLHPAPRQQYHRTSSTNIIESHSHHTLTQPRRRSSMPPMHITTVKKKGHHQFPQKKQPATLAIPRREEPPLRTTPDFSPKNLEATSMPQRDEPKRRQQRRASLPARLPTMSLSMFDTEPAYI